MTTVLAVYPLTESFRLELEQRFGPVEVMTIAELRRLGPAAEPTYDRRGAQPA